jgi:hypothetical protein
MTTSSPPAEREAHLQYGKGLFNDVWRLLDQEDRTPEDDALMIHEAHASAYHWRQVGTPANHARSEWLCSRVYCVLRRPEPALYHARLVLDICERNGIGDWDLGFAYEALARAHAVAGEAEASAGWLARAHEAAAAIAEDEDRDLLLSDLATIGT